MNPILRNLLIGAGVVLTIGFLARKQVATAVDAVANINVGTPFEGAGVIGTAGNIANQASGGLLADAGSAIGLFFSDIFDTRTLEDFDTGADLRTTQTDEFVGPPLGFSIQGGESINSPLVTPDKGTGRIAVEFPVPIAGDG